MASPELETSIIEPKQPCTHTLIFLHGRGDNGFNFGLGLTRSRSSSPIGGLRALFPSLRLIFPTAPDRLCTRYNETFTEWFDTWSLIDVEERSELQVEGLRANATSVHALIAAEIAKGIPASNIFLAGISQGCATGLHALLTGKYQLGGFVGVAGWMPFVTPVSAAGDAPLEKLRWLRRNLGMAGDSGEEDAAAPLKTPVFLCHGEMDTTINPEHGRRARDLLLALGMDVEFVSYPQGQHWYQVPVSLVPVRPSFWRWLVWVANACVRMRKGYDR